MANISCPKCGDQSYFSLAAYKGPFRCKKCKETFNIVIENDEVKSCQSLSQQEIDKLNLRTFFK